MTTDYPTQQKFIDTLISHDTICGIWERAMGKAAISKKQNSFNVFDPLSAMAEFEQLLVSNSGEDAFDCAIRLLAAKLVDEVNTKSGKEHKFRIHASLEKTYYEIENLYQLAVKCWPEINGSSTELGLSPSQLARSIRPLLGWKLIGSDLSLLDATLERLVSKSTKGSLGQYFTPREIIRLCVNVLNPSPTDTVIDPACGSGGFLLEASKYAIAQYGKSPKCLGIDFGAKAFKVAALLAAASANNSIVICKANSLDGRIYSNKSPHEWSNFLSNNVGSSTATAKSWGNWNRLGCSILLTNPPFAGDMDEPDVLSAYECAQRTKTKKSLTREYLFLERSVEMLKPGGRLAIVLPQGLLSNTSAAFLRQWLFGKCRILGVIGLHPFAFLPYTSVKTSLLFLEKLTDEKIAPLNKKVFFAVSRMPGKDSSGRNIGTTDYEELSNAFRRFLFSEKATWASWRESEIKEKENIICDIVPLAEVIETGRLDAEFFDPIVRVTSSTLREQTTTTLGDVVETNLTRFKRKHFGEISYFDISCVEEKTGLSFPRRLTADEAPSRATHIVSVGDVLVSTVRPERNVVSLITENLKGTGVASNGFCVLRPKRVAPEVVFAYCKSHIFRELLSRRATASMYPAVTDKDVLDIPFSEPPEEISEQIIELIDSAQNMIAEAHKKMEYAVSLMNEYLKKPIGKIGQR